MVSEQLALIVIMLEAGEMGLKDLNDFDKDQIVMGPGTHVNSNLTHAT